MEDMESLLDQESLEFRSLRRGDVVDGIVMDTSREGVLVDIGSKSEGLIPLNEMHSLGADPTARIKRGDEILVYVLQPESAEGQVLLSVDRARGEQGWRTLQKRFEDGESFEGEVTGFNKGGLLVNVEGVNAFVPLSQVVGVRPDRDEGGNTGDSSLAGTVGRKLRLKVIEINRRRNRVILSERAALQEWRSIQKDRLMAELHEGEIRRGRITSVRPFGVFVDLGGADGLAHLSELTWERGKTPEEVYKVGQEVDVFVMKVDPDTKKIALSLRRAQPERWDEIVDQYHPGEIVPGRVTKLVTFGAFARIDGPVEGLVHVSELSDRRITHPREVVNEGDIVPLKVVRIERDKHRIGLSLRQARDEAERQGWNFDDQGRVEGFPEYLRGEIETRLGTSPVRSPEDRGDERSDGDGAPQQRESASPREAAAQREPVPQREPQPPRENRQRDDRQRERVMAAMPQEDEEPTSAMGAAFQQAQRVAAEESRVAAESAASESGAASAESATVEPPAGAAMADTAKPELNTASDTSQSGAPETLEPSEVGGEAPPDVSAMPENEPAMDDAEPSPVADEMQPPDSQSEEPPPDRDTLSESVVPDGAPAQPNP